VSGCEHLREHYEAYALGALEGQERAEMKAHLARGCPACTAEVQRARWVVSQLAYLSPEAEPSASLRRHVVEAAQGVAPVRERRRWIPTWEWIAAAALVFLTVYSVYTARRSARELAALRDEIRAAQGQNAQLQQQRDIYQRAMAILSAPGTKETTLKPSGTASLPALRAYWNPELGVVMSGQRIPAPAAGRTFQLWVVPKKGNPVSAGIFRPEEAGRVLIITKAEASAGDVAALAISDEPAQGSAQPTTTPMWVGPVR